MTSYQSFNAAAGLDAAEIDRINSAFYGRFNYPWPPMHLQKVKDPAFFPRMACQEAGDFDGRRIPPDADIWVAGCGTNQAVITALRFPAARVVGTDISPKSLAVAESTARQLGLTNLRLEEASLNTAWACESFDYVLCTGVIHHNADPSVPLKSLVKALKPDGLLELMVYNYYHRIETTAFQKAIRLLSGAKGQAGLIEAELTMTQELIAAGLPGRMGPFLGLQRDLPEPAVADFLLQPVEYSYTVATLSDLCHAAGISLLQPCLNQFDKLSGNTSWDPPLGDGSARTAFESLDDIDRWQAANLLLQERSPMLWFYAGKDRHRATRDSVNRAFLERAFVPARSETESYLLAADGTYGRSDRAGQMPAPAAPIPADARSLYLLADGQTPMGSLIDRLGLPKDAATLTRLRTGLTTPAYPYLLAVPC